MYQYIYIYINNLRVPYIYHVQYHRLDSRDATNVVLVVKRERAMDIITSTILVAQNQDSKIARLELLKDETAR